MTDEPSALLTDQYELTMAASYFADGRTYPATFELFWRDLPRSRNFLIACGLEQALAYLESFRFSGDEISFLAGLDLFDQDFLEFLGDIRFSGEVWAITEGDAVFPLEPVLRVTAPLIEAQIVETYLLNCIDFQTLIASKAARLSIACRGRPFVDFSARRDHGADAAVLAARAAFVGGASATSNLLASKRFGVPASGTMAHSYVMTIGDEKAAFLSFARKFPDKAVLLIDTFDVIRAAHIAVDVAGELGPEGIQIRAVRIDSGDLAASVPEVRRILDDGGFPDIEIFVSGDLDEWRIHDLVSAGVRVDGFGVGTQLGTGGDAPFLGGSYKLVEDAGGPKFKLSSGKETLPGVKQVFRLGGEDVIALAEEDPVPGGRALLEHVMSGGRRVNEPEKLTAVQEYCMATLASLPPEILSLTSDTEYRVALSSQLKELAHGRHR